jgi:hypothetical protein
MEVEVEAIFLEADLKQFELFRVETPYNTQVWIVLMSPILFWSIETISVTLDSKTLLEIQIALREWLFFIMVLEALKFIRTKGTVHCLELTTNHFRNFEDYVSKQVQDAVSFIERRNEQSAMAGFTDVKRRVCCNSSIVICEVFNCPWGVTDSLSSKFSIDASKADEGGGCISGRMATI